MRSSSSSDSEFDQEKKRVNPEARHLINALKRSGTLSYPDKVKLVLKSSSLMLPFLVLNAAFIFRETHEQLKQGMLDNPYYQLYVGKLTETLAFEGSIVKSEAICITTTSVIIAVLSTFASLLYQTYRYRSNLKKSQPLLKLLKNKGYAHTNELLFYPLNDFEREHIPRLIQVDDIHANTTLPNKNFPLEQFFSDLLWFNGETSKYISPFLMLSLIPGLVLMILVSLDLREDLNCGPLPFWGVFFDVCSPIESVEVMSLLAYLWGCFSGTYLFLHSFALCTRVLLTPFPDLRKGFHQYINRPLNQCLAENQHYDQLIKKTLLALAMPPIVIYSLNSTLKFTHTYLAETGCTPEQAFSKAFFPGSPYPCSTTQASLGASVFIGAFEFEHLYPAYMILSFTAKILALFVRDRYPFQEPSFTENVKAALKQINWIEDRLFKGMGAFILIGGVVGLLPALRMSHAILQKEGVEIYLSLKNLLNQSLPGAPEGLPPFNLMKLMAGIPACTISDLVNLPPLDLANRSIPGFNFSVPCFESFFDPVTNDTILGIQITPPCPESSLYYIYVASLFHLPLDCDPILVVRTMAGFVAPYWLSVNAFGGLGFSLTLVILCTLSCLDFFCPWIRPSGFLPAQNEAIPTQTEIELAVFSEKEEKYLSSPSEEKTQTQCWIQFKARFFPCCPRSVEEKAQVRTEDAHPLLVHFRPGETIR